MSCFQRKNSLSEQVKHNKNLYRNAKTCKMIPIILHVIIKVKSHTHIQCTCIQLMQIEGSFALEVFTLKVHVEGSLIINITKYFEGASLIYQRKQDIQKFHKHWIFSAQPFTLYGSYSANSLKVLQLWWHGLVDHILS